MSNEEIRQRIAYLVEHGGLYDDPLGDLRRLVRRAIAAFSMGLIITWALVVTTHV
jgi:hypothetical protein